MSKEILYLQGINIIEFSNCFDFFNEKLQFLLIEIFGCINTPDDLVTLCENNVNLFKKLSNWWSRNDQNMLAIKAVALSSTKVIKRLLICEVAMNTRCKSLLFQEHIDLSRWASCFHKIRVFVFEKKLTKIELRPHQNYLIRLVFEASMVIVHQFLDNNNSETSTKVLLSLYYVSICDTSILKSTIILCLEVGDYFSFSISYIDMLKCSTRWLFFSKAKRDEFVGNKLTTASKTL